MHIDNRPSLRVIDGLLSYPVALHEPPSPDLRGRWARLLTALRIYWRERREAEELAALSDRMLADIGLTRADLPRIPRRGLFDGLR